MTHNDDNEQLDGLKMTAFMSVFTQQYQDWMYLLPKDILFDELFKTFPEEMKVCANAIKDLIQDTP